MDLKGKKSIEAHLGEYVQVFPHLSGNEQRAQYITIGQTVELSSKREVRAVEILNTLVDNGFMNDSHKRDLLMPGPLFDLVTIDTVTQTVYLKDTRA